MVQAPSPLPPEATLEALVEEIQHFEAIVSEWDEAQRATVAGYKRAIENLHRAALIRLIRRVKQASLPAIRAAAEDELVYVLLRYYDLVKPRVQPLEERIQLALEEVRPHLKSHNGDVELVAIRPPDTVEVRLVGTCSHCPASSLTLSDGVEQAIKRHCPEINRVVAVNTQPEISAPTPTPSLAPHWLELTSLAEVPTQGVLAMKVEGRSLLLTRTGSTVVCFHNACSHLGLPLDSGPIEQGILTCPDHGFRYRLETGACLTVPAMPLQQYPVQVQDGRVFIQVPPVETYGRTS